MNKKNIAKILYVLAALLVVVGCVCVGVDYIQYNATLNSAPFSVWILARAIEFGLPAVILLVVAVILQRKQKG